MRKVRSITQRSLQVLQQTILRMGRSLRVRADLRFRHLTRTSSRIRSQEKERTQIVSSKCESDPSSNSSSNSTITPTVENIELTVILKNEPHTFSIKLNETNLAESTREMANQLETSLSDVLQDVFDTKPNLKLETKITFYSMLLKQKVPENSVPLIQKLLDDCLEEYCQVVNMP